MSNERIVGRIIITAKIKLESPLLIGGGDSEADIGVLRDSDAKPYIPGTAFAGALRHYFEHNKSGIDAQQAEYFWGSPKSNSQGQQSAFYLQDLQLENEAQVVVRDGVCIGVYGTAEDKKKYDYEVVEPGAVFALRAEVIIRRAFHREQFLKMINFLGGALDSGLIELGAMTAKGFGRFSLLEWQLCEYDFKQKNDVIRWLEGAPGQALSLEKGSSVGPNSEDLVIDATFLIPHSLLIRSYSKDPKAPDATHITSAGVSVIPGTSLKGAIRSRAERIFATLGKGNKNDLRLLKLFGWADEQAGSNGVKYKSRVMVGEGRIEAAVSEAQTRVKIDRFTGGALDGHLFDALPIWSNKDGKTCFTLNLRVKNCQLWEAGLIMMALKDLWNGDLALGGEKSIGRGVLAGDSARIHYQGREYLLKRTQTNADNGLELHGDLAAMESWAQNLVDEEVRL
jgi:CRISPR/Cas system CSM-associated protein Csm3 (group 7 of RAMP superfamily)